jgi:hypothetical protein
MRWFDALGPRNCWLNPDADDAILFACCMVNIGYSLIAASGALTVALILWRVFA